ncbi:MAG: helix-turn-helix transcriptional regulator [Clostridia bacterium]|nr:helix-turn-helix transcriptional regulator [Clostridia bacterium]
MDLSSIGINIKKYRKIKKITQEELALNTNLTPNYIGMIERGEKIPSLETFITILNALDASADKVLTNVLNTGYLVKFSELSDHLSLLSVKDRDMINAVVKTLIQHSSKISE